METTTAALMVMANSRKRRPTMPDMKISGMKTPMRERLRETTVKPICLAPLSAATMGAFPRLDEADDVFDHDNGVIHHEAGGDGQGHEGKIVQAEAEQVHQAEGADDGQGQGDAGNDGGPERAQKEEDDHHHQADGQEEGELNVVDGGADHLGAVAEDLDVDGRREWRSSAWAAAL